MGPILNDKEIKEIYIKAKDMVITTLICIKKDLIY